MNAKPYKIIFALLSFSLLAILLLQAFWIKNFYHQKQEEFDSGIYVALSNISNKLNERENIDYIKNSTLAISNVSNKINQKEKTGGKDDPATISTQTKITRNGSSMKVVVSTSSGVKIDNENLLKEMQMDSLMGQPRVLISDSMGSSDNFQQTIVIRNKSNHSAPREEDINKLLNKMLMEIKTINVSPIEDITEDSLREIIKSELETKGVFIPFEFLMKKENKTTDEVLAKSKGFDPELKFYKAGLSTDKVFKDSNYLYVQFPNAKGLVFARMKNMLTLAALFSLIILVVFYFTLRTILKQRKLNEIKNDFINNMTHELKTPIATISLAIDALNNSQIKNDEKRFAQYTTILKEENQKLNANVERVLQMAMLDKGELGLDKKQLDINELIHSAIESHQLQIAKQNAEVIFDSNEESCFTLADGYHLLAVFNNLLDNALKYSNAKCVIQISVRSVSGEAIICFKDNGVGIDSAAHKRIFDKFYRVQAGNLHDVKGFGLGLSYVKSIIEKHGGTIYVQSEKNKGAEFIIKLPLI